MGKLSVYNFVSANGYFKGLNEDISWAKQDASDEANEFATENLQSGNILLFGRVTIGNGTPFLNGINKKLELELTKTKSLKSGIVLLCYQPLEKKAANAGEGKRAMAHEKNYQLSFSSGLHQSCLIFDTQFYLPAQLK